MGCIEMSSTFPPTRINGKFNRNMGCIEIKHVHTGDSGTERLIETWDVLKSLSFLHSLSIDNKFNRNMGCIEITRADRENYGDYSLIETWDVLK